MQYIKPISNCNQIYENHPVLHMQAAGNTLILKIQHFQKNHTFAHLNKVTIKPAVKFHTQNFFF